MKVPHRVILWWSRLRIPHLVKCDYHLYFNIELFMSWLNVLIKLSMSHCKRSATHSRLRKIQYPIYSNWNCGSNTTLICGYNVTN